MYSNSYDFHLVLYLQTQIFSNLKIERYSNIIRKGALILHQIFVFCLSHRFRGETMHYLVHGRPHLPAKALLIPCDETHTNGTSILQRKQISAQSWNISRPIRSVTNVNENHFAISAFSVFVHIV